MTRPEEVVLVSTAPGPEFLVALRSPESHGYWHLVAGGVEEGEAADGGTRASSGRRPGYAPAASTRSRSSSATGVDGRLAVMLHPFVARRGRAGSRC